MNPYSTILAGTRIVPPTVLLALFVGCSQQPHPGVTAPARGQSTQMNDTDSWLTVSAEPAEVERARDAAAKAQTDQCENIFSSLESSPYIDIETMELLEQDRGASVERLQVPLNLDRITDEMVGATMLLCRMHEEAGRTQAARILQTGSTEQRLRVLRGLDGGVYDDAEKAKYQNFLFADQKLINSLLAQLDDPDEAVVKAAIQCCGYLGVPGVTDRFVEMLRRASVPDKDRLLYWLSRGELTEALFNVAVEASKDLSPGNYWGASIFEAFAKSADEPLQTRAKHQLRAILKAWPDEGRQGYNGSRLSILSTLSEAAVQADLAWLRDLLSFAKRSDTVTG